jgi:spermidine synthase
MKISKLIIALLSLSLIALELIWTRIFSAEFFYTFAFLVLSLALLGLGLGALSVRLFGILNRPNSLAINLLFTGLMTILSPILVFQLGLDFTQLFVNWIMILKLIAAIILLNSTFYFGGISLAILFKQNHAEISTLYMADLVGAGIGVLIAVFFMNVLGTPATTFLCAMPVLIACIIISNKWIKVISILLILISIIPFKNAESLLEAEQKERAPVIYKHWDAMSKIKVYDYGEKYRGINIDNIANTTVNAFDGNWNIPDTLKFGFNIVDYLMSQQDNCTFLSLGAGGGQDVFQALQFGATEVHAVEVNGFINDLLLEGDLAEFSGYIYKDPRVIVVTEDARSYVRRFFNKFDLIYSFSSNSFSAMASGAFAMAENYLFTTEAFIDYWKSLSENGYLLMEHQFYMPRIISEVIDALKIKGVENPKEYFAVYDLPNMKRKMLFLSKQPLTHDFLIPAFGDQTKEQFDYGYLLYPCVDSLKNNLINQIVQKGWEETAKIAPVNISPTTDNNPYVAQLGLWKNFNTEKLDKIIGFADLLGFPLSKIIIYTILFIVILLILPLNLIPYFFKGTKLKVTPWLYFFFIGMGFMMIEVILIQKYALFIGSSVYSIVTVLLTLLLFSGIGSFFSKKFSNKIVFISILVWLVLEVFVFVNITESLGYLDLIPRMLISMVILAPLAFFMGMPFPKGTVRVGELVDWGFAVNGTASVLGSTLIVLIAFSAGFKIALLIGGLMYLCAYALISLKIKFVD